MINKITKISPWSVLEKFHMGSNIKSIRDAVEPAPCVYSITDESHTHTHTVTQSHTH